MRSTVKHPVVPATRIDFRWELQDWETALTPQVVCEIEDKGIACSISFYSHHHQANPDMFDSWIVTLHSTKYRENDKFRASEQFAVTDNLVEDLANMRYWLFEEFQYLCERIEEYEQQNEAIMAFFRALVKGRV